MTEKTKITLTAREQQCIKGVIDGLTNKQIAAQLGCTSNMVRNDLHHLSQKLHARNRAHLAQIASRAGWTGNE